MQPLYVNKKGFAFRYDPEKFTFQCFYHNWNGETEFLFLEGYAERKNGEPIPSLPEPDVTKTDDTDPAVEEQSCRFQYTSEKNGSSIFDLRFTLKNEEMSICFSGDIVLKAVLHWGDDPEQNTFSGLFESNSTVLHSAAGPVIRAGDDMLYDRKDDRVLRFIPCGRMSFSFDWQKKEYNALFEQGSEVHPCFRIQIMENCIARKFHIPYHPIEKKNWFSTPPVSWMTWYACGLPGYDPKGNPIEGEIRFDANEAEVLENTKQMKNLLGPYCDNLVTWVDWEWYHGDYSGKNETCDSFTARPDAFPHGMKYLADQIKAMGCIPAIWTGMTNDVRPNKWFREHCECVHGPTPFWCGQWFVDPGYPEVYEEYVPMVMNQLKEWGYQGVKWDCIYVAHVLWGRYYDQLKKPVPGFWSAMRRFVKAGRKALGDDIFFLYCNMATDSHLSSGCGVVNSARIGGDIFKWNEFIEQAVDTLFRLYPFHNTVFYADCDNMVLRKRFNTLEQARSRVSFYGLTGVPLTIGDRFSEYTPELLDMVRRIVPVVDMHPVELQSKKENGPFRVLLSNYSRPFGSWQVADIMNTVETEKEFTLNFEKDCRLAGDAGQKYAVYDYWKQEFLGVFEKFVTIRIAPYDSAVLRITPVTNVPTLISSSRHITQGGYELIEYTHDPDGRRISGKVKCIGNEAERLTFLLPDGMQIKAAGGSWSQQNKVGILTVLVSQNSNAEWTLEYTDKKGENN